MEGIAMNCHKVQSLVSAYVDCELSGLEMLAVRRHLSDCEQCRQEVEAILAIKRSFGSLRPRHPAEGLVDRIFRRLDQAAPSVHEQILAAFRTRFTVFPGKIRLAAVGMSLFAVLLVLRAGQMGTVNYATNPIPAALRVSTQGGENPIHLFSPSSLVEAASFNPDVPLKPPVGPWGLSGETEKPSNFTGTAGLVLTNYTIPR